MLLTFRLHQSIGSQIAILKQQNSTQADNTSEAAPKLHNHTGSEDSLG